MAVERREQAFGGPGEGHLKTAMRATCKPPSKLVNRSEACSSKPHQHGNCHRILLALALVFSSYMGLWFINGDFAQHRIFVFALRSWILWLRILGNNSLCASGQSGGGATGRESGLGISSG